MSGVTNTNINAGSNHQDVSNKSSLYLGIDASTQSLKLIVIDAQKRIHQHVSINYARDCPEFGTRDGIIRGDYGFGPLDSADGSSASVITSPSLMFVRALELGLERLVASGVAINRVVAVSGSGQQHGSIWWKRGSKELLQKLHPASTLTSQLASAFSLPNGPIWMDSSASSQCLELERRLGGAQRLADLTGSRAFERFTGNQISRIHGVLPKVYEETERIGLVSSMIATLFIGGYAPIDASDGAGMNLMNLKPDANGVFEWNEACLQACVSMGSEDANQNQEDMKVAIATLRDKLGPIVDSRTSVGTIHPYFVSRFGFVPACQVYACSGDNPCTLVGLDLTESGACGVSLGSSDTLFAVTAAASTRPSGEGGHIFPHPLHVDTQAFLMLCIKNGSMTRQKVRDHVLSLGSNETDKDIDAWARFNAILRETPVGNHGRFFLAFHECEILPATHATGYFVVDAADDDADDDGESEEPRRLPVSSSSLRDIDPGHVLRGLIESQCLSLRIHARRLGLTQPSKLVVTGGASSNVAILQVLADVFGVDIEGHACIDDTTGAQLGHFADTAALGAAIRAMHAHQSLGNAQSDGASPLSPVHSSHSHPSPSSPPSTSSSSSATSPSPTSPTPTPIRRLTSHILARCNAEHHAVYTNMLDRFERLQQRCVDILNQEYEK